MISGGVASATLILIYLNMKGEHLMARICPLFSSSSGNSTYIKDKDSGILVDVGVSYKSLCEALEKSGGDIGTVKAVCITHEHTDHIKGLSTLLKKTGIPLITSEKTAATLDNAGVIPSGTSVIIPDNGTEIGDFGISRFATSHDCDGSSGYNIFLKDGRKISVCTDLGIVTDDVREHLSGSEAIVFESNHDVEMLRRGPYPPQLKLRILSDKGHLSNVACASELPYLLKNGTTRFILAHLSMHNNLPMLAKSASAAALGAVGAKADEDYILTVAKPSGNGVTAI